MSSKQSKCGSRNTNVNDENNDKTDKADDQVTEREEQSNTIEEKEDKTSHKEEVEDEKEMDESASECEEEKNKEGDEDIKNVTFTVPSNETFEVKHAKKTAPTDPIDPTAPEFADTSELVSINRGPNRLYPSEKERKYSMSEEVDTETTPVPKKEEELNSGVILSSDIKDFDDCESKNSSIVDIDPREKYNSEEDYSKLPSDGKHKYNQNMLQFVRPSFSSRYVKNEPSRDINIGYVRLNWLVDISTLQDNLLPECKGCSALLNSLSHVSYNKWTCEFCETINYPDAKPPRSGTTLEILEDCSMKDSLAKIILCVDISPSMNATIVEMADQNTPKYLRKGKEYISYWMKVQRSICNLINNIATDSPNTIVGLIFFASNLLIYGDTTKKFVNLNDTSIGEGNLFMNKKRLTEIITKHTKGFMTQPISRTKEKLKEVVRSVCPDQGQTALGPALLAADILLGEDNVNSHVVVLTDGGANYGIGNLQDARNIDSKFYNSIAKKFKEKGAIASIFTFGNNPCSLVDLTVLSRETQGVMVRNEFPKKTPVITLPTHVQEISNIEIQVIAHKDLELRSASDVSSERSAANKIINRRAVMLLNSVFYFEYNLANRNNKNAPKSFPIQTKITYHKDGKRMRRTATDYVTMVPSPPEVDFHEFDVLIKYGAKSATYILGGAKIEESNLISNTLKNILTMLNNSKRETTKRTDCIAKIKKYIEAIRNKYTDDKRISSMIEEATVDNTSYY